MTKMDNYQNFIAKSRYSRFLTNDNRRENWTETVDRYFTFLFNL
jgi:ribonucleoside-triphosphate reductase